jgi:hypothetical protein
MEIFPAGARVGSPGLLGHLNEQLQSRMGKSFVVTENGGGNEVLGATEAVNSMLLQVATVPTKANLLKYKHDSCLAGCACSSITFSLLVAPSLHCNCSRKKVSSAFSRPGPSRSLQLSATYVRTALSWCRLSGM